MAPRGSKSKASLDPKRKGAKKEGVDTKIDPKAHALLVQNCEIYKERFKKAAEILGDQRVAASKLALPKSIDPKTGSLAELAVWLTNADICLARAQDMMTDEELEAYCDWRYPLKGK
jgi:erythromycin esterase-like protein